MSPMSADTSAMSNGYSFSLGDFRCCDSNPADVEAQNCHGTVLADNALSAQLCGIRTLSGVLDYQLQRKAWRSPQLLPPARDYAI
jgi:hypothetical protein